MTEQEFLKAQIDKAREERIAQNLERLNEALPKAKEIVDMDLQLDNSREGATVYEYGERVSIYKKGDIYYLGHTQQDTPLYHPTKHYDQIFELYLKQNADISPLI